LDIAPLLKCAKRRHGLWLFHPEQRHHTAYAPKARSPESVKAAPVFVVRYGRCATENESDAGATIYRHDTFAAKRQALMRATDSGDH
jgi:hypothetical protein